MNRIEFKDVHDFGNFENGSSRIGVSVTDMVGVARFLSIKKLIVDKESTSLIPQLKPVSSILINPNNIDNLILKLQEAKQFFKTL
jgi:hypothetical protein